MAIVKYAAPFADIRGTSGGITHSANRSGPYIKNWAKGSNPRSLLQSTHRATMASFSRDWSTLSSANVALWVAYAALPAQDKINSVGETYSASGYNWYVATNMNLRQIGVAPVLVPPVLGIPAAPSISAFHFKTQASPTSTRIELSAPLANATDRLMVYARVFNSDGRHSIASIKDFVVAEIPNVADKIFFNSEMVAKFGTTIAEQKAFFSVATMTIEGRRGTFSTGTAIATDS